MKICIFVIHIILHGCRKIVLNCNVDLILSETLIAESPIGLIIHANIILRARQVFSQFMHLMNPLVIMEYAKPKGFQNFIVNIFNVILKGGPVIVLHDFTPTRNISTSQSCHNTSIE